MGSEMCIRDRGVGLVAIGSFSGVGLVAKSVGLKAINFGNQMWLLVTFQVCLVAKKIKDSFNLHAQAKEPLDASRSLQGFL